MKRGGFEVTSHELFFKVFFFGGGGGDFLFIYF